MDDPFAALTPFGTQFAFSNTSLNLGASSNNTSARVGQSSDLFTQDATHVPVRNEPTSGTEGYEPKAESSQAIPEIAPGLVSRGIERISNLMGRSNSSPGTPSRTSPRSPVSQRQNTGNPPIADVYACDWTSFSNPTNPNANRVDFPSEAGGAQQQVASPRQGVQQDYLMYVAQGEELQRIQQTLEAMREQQQRTELHLDERETELARCHQELAFLRFQLDMKGEPEQFTELPPPRAVPAMAATVGPPTTYAPPNAPNPFVGCGKGYQENPYRTLTGFPPVQASAPPPPPQAERVEQKWPFVSAMFGLGGG
eukprot:3865162-Amphidinium_carterae.1